MAARRRDCARQRALPQLPPHTNRAIRGTHSWLDWCQGAAEGVPVGVRSLFAELPFNDVAAGRELIRARAPRLAAVVVEPVVVSEPTREWLQMLRVETARAG